MKKVFVYVLPFAFFGCSAVVDPEISMKPPTYVEELAPKQSNNVESAPGSLFGKGDNPLFSDKKAMNVNDLVTVVIQESTTQSTQANKTTSRTNNANLGGGALTGSTGAANKVLNRINAYSNIGFRTNSTNNYTGTGTQSRNESFNTTISTRVIKILSNGNYFIEGSRELLINGEKQIIQLSGVIRPYDIGQDNTIDSKYIADAKILYKTEGEVDRSTRKPWGSKFIEAVWPF
ncbi:flagellar basal body L-ring protein FlgH [Campylobacter helveticus]|uniref:Flagellar L-ring protein n=1 Tax=Campylobacter helveticus TaxID=28898 RepID=A0AAX2UH16_9BACT|nr:flagellar basal body L-ring protein FlgH [Campylobacter helveticus]ARE80409.1 flagellar L-ring protein [Campylobacter helveticus]MCR2054288.1 flagellar basal body L-ring protein FlgH [Campylobacter helveticus]MCR2059815.1 flagellar basal body L-ring protein FlgH [Campylobacter helveticus]MCR2063961.1 flagellar basal body L-ring protein FlgH [Campylobacter helveticus]MCR2066718.1 flagellar basal body L-ring protein FlgH [Campylobacter helveticus]